MSTTICKAEKKTPVIALYIAVYDIMSHNNGNHAMILRKLLPEPEFDLASGHNTVKHMPSATLHVSKLSKNYHQKSTQTNELAHV